MVRTTIAVLAFATIASSAGMAQVPPQVKVGPTGMLLRSLCLPWLSGADATALTAAAERNGFKAKFIGQTLTGFSAPEPLQSKGWFGVRFSETRNWCEIDMAWPGSSRVTPVASEVEALIPALPPSWHFVAATPVRDAWGNLPDRAWTAPAGTLWIRERPNDLAPEANALAMTLHIAKK